MSNTIKLHARDNHVYDGEASATVTPGELIEVSGVSGNDLTYQPHSTAGGSAAGHFAVEYSHTGKGVDDDYASGDHMELHKALTGDQVYAWLAAGENVGTGDFLVSAGNGALQAGDGTQDAVHVCKPVESVDNSGGASPVRIKVEVV